MKILFLAEAEPEKGMSPASRYRVYQYLDALMAKGIECKILPSFPSKYFMKKGHWQWLLRRVPPLYYLFILPGLILMVLTRLSHLIWVAQADVVIIQREILPGRPGPILEKLVRRFAKRVVFDLDDAIYLSHPTQERGWFGQVLEAFSDRDMVAKILEISDSVIAGNTYLADYARKYNDRVYVIPTPVDVGHYPVKEWKVVATPVVVGWIGTSSNLAFLEGIVPALEEVAKRHPLLLRIVSNKIHRSMCFGSLNYEFVAWKGEREVEDILSFDIGLMPLPDNEWTRGKCGFKALQYMACGIPVVISPVGINKEIVQDGINGYLAETKDEWVEKISNLISDLDLRKRIGLGGRKTVEEAYSVGVNIERLVKVFNDTVRG